MALPDRIALVGFMGSGKSTVGRLLATAVGYQFVDVDTLIEREAGMSIPELFRRAGEEAFRALETRMLLSLGTRRSVVIATGGGAPMRDVNHQFLCTRCRCFYLEISAAEAQRRVGGSGGRPLLAANPEGIAELLEARHAIYAATGHTIPAEGRSPLQVVAAIRALLRRHP
ncbi:MAG: shikimate kinase [Spirochaetaceae bacterium]|nr:shikimate kinase [Spirochaetaceae bacterium]